MKSNGKLLLSAVFLVCSLIASAQTKEGARLFSSSNSSQVVNVQQSGSGYALKANTPSTSAVGAIFGKASAGSGFTNGLWGQSFSSKGVGVRGEAKASSGSATGGAFFSSSTAGVGVFGSACNPNSTATCNGVGVWGVVNGLNQGNSTAALFEIRGSDGGQNLIKGVFAGSNVFRVDSSGNVFADGCYCVGGADFAESFAVNGNQKSYGPGDVLVIDPSSDRQVSRSHDAYSTLVAGIYSTKPGVLAAPQKLEGKMPAGIPMAIVGVVPTKVSAENGSIQRGDLLVTAATPGYAMKGTDRSRMMGAVLGKALQPLSAPRGIIQVLVTLQ